MKYSPFITITILLSTLNFYSANDISKQNSNDFGAVKLTQATDNMNQTTYLNASSINTRLKEGKQNPDWFSDVNYKLESINAELNELKIFEINKTNEINIVQQGHIKDDQEINQIEAIFDKLQVRSTIVATTKIDEALVKTETDKKTITEPDYWTTLYSVETKQGLLLYRPKNKVKNCTVTSSPCGHHQLSVQALKDIGCKTTQCKKDREDFEKSLVMSKQLQALNDKRLKKAGITNLPEYQQYLVHQQGASGLKKLIAAHRGQKKLSKRMKKNMANNSPFSYKKLRKLSSKQAANKFMQHWKQKWEDEKDLIKVSLKTIPIFDEHELNIALNLNLRY